MFINGTEPLKLANRSLITDSQEEILKNRYSARAVSGSLAGRLGLMGTSQL